MPGRWYTCAPRRFAGNEGFFIRDSGLICRGLQQLGYESKAIMPGPPMEDDLPDLLRASTEQLSSPEWWRALELDGVIMVAWGMHKHTPIVRAIAEAGIPLALHIDGANVFFPFKHQWDYLKTLWRHESDLDLPKALKVVSCLKRYIVGALVLSIKHSLFKYRHLRYTNLLTCQTPTSVEGHEDLCRAFGGTDHGINITLAGNPVSPCYGWDASVVKQRKVIAVGRWDDFRFKRPKVLAAVAEALLRRNPDVVFDIYGQYTGYLENWHRSLEPSVAARARLHGRQPATVISQSMREAQVFLCPSSSEGAPVAAFEALICSTVPVGIDSPNMPVVRWAAGKNQGEAAERDTPESYVAAVERALCKWQEGQYDPAAIHQYWEQWARMDIFLKRIIEEAPKARRAIDR